MITRRNFLKSTAATGVALSASTLAAPAIAQGAKIKLGYVSPQSGPLAAFAEADICGGERYFSNHRIPDQEPATMIRQDQPEKAGSRAT